jgi:hypothetical protein
VGDSKSTGPHISWSRHRPQSRITGLGDQLSAPVCHAPPHISSTDIGELSSVRIRLRHYDKSSARQIVSLPGGLDRAQRHPIDVEGEAAINCTLHDLLICAIIAAPPRPFATP